jgi:hypothetical protein
MKWKIHILYDNGVRVEEWRTINEAIVSIDEAHTMRVHTYGSDGKPDGGLITLAHTALRCWTELGSLYFSGYEKGLNDAMVYQAIMLEPSKDYDSHYDPTYCYPLEAVHPFYMADDELPLHFVLDDMHRHSHFRLERDQIETVLRTIHKACGKRFEAWLRREILGEKDA